VQTTSLIANHQFDRGGEEFFPIWFFHSLCALRRFSRTLVSSSLVTKETHMSWKTPRVIEIAVGMEINCYACADI
jgi:coenzyme PQQ precursor peptide PqqA